MATTVCYCLGHDAWLAGVDDWQHSSKQITKSISVSCIGSRECFCGGGGVQSYEGSPRGAITAKSNR